MVTTVLHAPTAECLRHYLDSLPRERFKAGKARQPFLQFVGVTIDGMQKYLCGENSPIGLNLLRVRWFLAQQGYHVTELEHMTDRVRLLSELVANRLLKPDIASQAIGFTQKRFVDVINGKQPLAPARHDAVDRIINSYENIQSVLPQTVFSTEPSALPRVGDTVLCVTPDTPPSTSAEKRVLLVSLIEQLRALQPLLEFVVSDACTPADRTEVRNRTGYNFVFKLNNDLTALCGERARDDRDRTARRPR